eukprot:6278399-Alexandrium_andersonii.AAC.1
MPSSAAEYGRARPRPNFPERSASSVRRGGITGGAQKPRFFAVTAVTSVMSFFSKTSKAASAPSGQMT